MQREGEKKNPEQSRRGCIIQLEKNMFPVSTMEQEPPLWASTGAMWLHRKTERFLFQLLKRSVLTLLLSQLYLCAVLKDTGVLFCTSCASFAELYQDFLSSHRSSPSFLRCMNHLTQNQMIDGSKDEETLIRSLCWIVLYQFYDFLLFFLLIARHQQLVVQ